MAGQHSALLLVLVQPVSDDGGVEETHGFDGHCEAGEGVGLHFFFHDVLAAVQTQPNKASFALSPYLRPDLDTDHLKEAQAEVLSGLIPQQLLPLFLRQSAGLHLSQGLDFPGQGHYFGVSTRRQRARDWGTEAEGWGMGTEEFAEDIYFGRGSPPGHIMQTQLTRTGLGALFPFSLGEWRIQWRFQGFMRRFSGKYRLGNFAVCKSMPLYINA